MTRNREQKKKECRRAHSTSFLNYFKKNPSCNPHRKKAIGMKLRD
jgi:hypothetical protein